MASFRSWKRIPVVVYRCVRRRPSAVSHQSVLPTSPILKCDLQAPEERGRDRPVQPARDQLVGLEEHGRRVPGDVYCEGLSDGDQGALRSLVLPTAWRSSRLLRRRFWYKKKLKKGFLPTDAAATGAVCCQRVPVIHVWF